MSNFIANALKSIWFDIENFQPIIMKIQNSFFDNDPNHIIIGINLFEMILKNLSINVDFYSFHYFRNLCDGYKVKVLPIILNTVNQIIQNCLSQISSSNASPNKIIFKTLESGLEVLYEVVYFPFSVTFNLYKYETKIDDNTTTIFPEYFYSFVSNIEYISLMENLVLSGKLSYNSSLLIIKILSKLTSCRSSLLKNPNLESSSPAEVFFEEEMTQPPANDSIHKLAIAFQNKSYELSISFTTVAEKFKSYDMVTEILDLIIRTFVSY